MPEQVAPPSAPDAAAPQPAVETPQPSGPPPAAMPSAAAGGEAGRRPAGSQPEAADPQAAKPEAADPQAASERRPQAPAGRADPQAATGAAGRPRPPGDGRAGGEEVRCEEGLGIVGAILAIVVIAGLKFGLASAIGNYFNKDETADAKAGDCIAELPEITGTEQEEVDGAKVVECTSTDAAYSVVGRVDGQSEAQAKAGTTCDPVLQGGRGGLHLLQHRAGQDGLRALPDQEGLTDAVRLGIDGGGSRPRRRRRTRSHRPANRR